MPPADDEDAIMMITMLIIMMLCVCVFVSVWSQSYLHFRFNSKKSLP